MVYVSLALFVIATCGTPGPNNNMIMSSGVNHGFRRSFPHAMGINVGFPVMVVAVGLGIDGLLRDHPEVLDLLRPAGAAYLLYLAWRIASAPVGEEERGEARPLSAVQAALFQFVNPKSWVMVVGAVTTYAAALDGGHVWNIVAVALVFLVFGTPCTFFWLLLGIGLKRVLNRPRQFRVFNVSMAVLLVLSLIPVIVEIVESAGKYVS
ncbi:LysE family translocator [Streptomyces sp. HNM0574]|uniref:LysE family translocator n=1 Tax=Streptomyces sp. HNM0574 TaxID=2714954 RepID=UPI00146E99C8|nr:LysE family translocator [Streptomyces sp. HNM0574]NLU69501.1 LysE family translocator [Streptomyces sp. HNM0574]